MKLSKSLDPQSLLWRIANSVAEQTAEQRPEYSTHLRCHCRGLVFAAITAFAFPEALLPSSSNLRISRRISLIPSSLPAASVDDPSNSFARTSAKPSALPRSPRRECLGENAVFTALLRGLCDNFGESSSPVELDGSVFDLLTA